MQPKYTFNIGIVMGSKPVRAVSVLVFAADTLDYDGNRALNIECNIGWTTLGHTGGPVPVFAIGKGAEKFNGRIDNTDIKGKILGE